MEENLTNYKKQNKMTYNYFYYESPISKKNFLSNIPEDWESEVDESGEYSYGGYRAVERD